ncbi:MAG: LamG-like jellyroll fold domain-containing protein, partial [Planctomycetota bacterium]
PWTIGQEWDGFRRTDFFKGKIDDVKIYGRALSAEQIEQLYQSQAAIYQEPSASSGLIAHWKFDEGSGSIAYDSVGKNHGTIHGATWTTGTELMILLRHLSVSIRMELLHIHFRLWFVPIHLIAEEDKCFVLIMGTTIGRY